VRQATRWIAAGCEVGIYPYVIPFSGSALARNPELAAQTVYETVTVAGTTCRWRQATKILPADSLARDAILEIENRVELAHRRLSRSAKHVPSRVRALLWLRASHEVLTAMGVKMAPLDPILARLSWMPDPKDRVPRVAARRVAAASHASP
jgi:hypothetical protein